MKNTKTVIFLLLISSLTFGQDASIQNRLNQLRAQKVAFITQKVNLTSQEAQIFWPVYNEFAQKKDRLNKQLRDITLELRKNWENLSENEKENLADRMVAFKLEEAKLDIEYHSQFKKILSIEKVLKLYQAENDFKSQLLNQIRKQSLQPKDQRTPKRK